MPTVMIYWSPGRTPEQKQKIVGQITETLVADGGARREDILIIFQDITPGDSARGGKMLVPPALNTPPHDDSGKAADER